MLDALRCRCTRCRRGAGFRRIGGSRIGRSACGCRCGPRPAGVLLAWPHRSSRTCSPPTRPCSHASRVHCWCWRVMQIPGASGLRARRRAHRRARHWRGWVVRHPQHRGVSFRSRGTVIWRPVGPGRSVGAHRCAGWRCAPRPTGALARAGGQWVHRGIDASSRGLSRTVPTATRCRRMVVHPFGGGRRRQHAITPLRLLGRARDDRHARQPRAGDVVHRLRSPRSGWRPGSWAPAAGAPSAAAPATGGPSATPRRA